MSDHCTGCPLPTKIGVDQRHTHYARLADLCDFVPDQDEIIVERLRAAGAIAIGKTNTPEFGAGSQTYNEVFGETLNPYDLSKPAVVVAAVPRLRGATGMLPIADGSDLGGSLRNPANFAMWLVFDPRPVGYPLGRTASAGFRL